MITEHWKVPKMWKGGDCWIIGGGLSMPRQFGVPEDVIEQVNNQQTSISVYSQYMSELHYRNVIGVNVAFLLGSWISVLYFCDGSFYRNYRKDILRFSNIKATCVNHLPRSGIDSGEINVIKRLKRDTRYGLSTRADIICWNHNSGGAAINFATLAGVKRVLLLGFDMKWVDNKTHWHHGLPGYQKPQIPATYRKFLRSFPAIAEDAKRNRVEILNVNTDSAIKQFPQVQLKDVL